MKLSKEEKARIVKQRSEDKEKITEAKKQFVVNGDLGCAVALIRYILCSTNISHRRLQGILEQESSGYIANVLSGKKRLTYKHAVLLANACSMNKGEKAEFYEGVLMQKEGK